MKNMAGNWTIRRRLLPSLSDLVFSTTLAYLLLFGQGPSTLLVDSDTGWHIRAGEWILDNLAVPRQDLFSFSKPGQEWFAWEWLSEALFAGIHRAAGLSGLVLAAGILIALTFALLYRLMRRQGSNPVLSAGLAFLAAYAASIHWLARPHLSSWLLALAFYWILEQTPIERRRIYWLAPLTALWTNLHGSFVLGVAMVGVYGVGELIRAALVERPERRASLQRAAGYGFLLGACAMATLVNPYGVRVHWHVLRYLNDSYIFNHITEFFSPNFHAPAARFFEVLLLAGVACAVWAVRQGRYAQALLVAGFAHAGLQSARHIPIYAIFAAPLIAAAATRLLAQAAATQRAGWRRSLLSGWERFGADVGAIDSRPRVYALSGLVVLTAMAVLWVPRPGGPPERQAQFSTRVFPVAAADHLEKMRFAGNVFSTDQWSGYLLYRAFPRIKVFMDGRSDYYGQKMGEEYLKLLGVHHTWQHTLDRYGVETALLPADSALAGALKESARWSVAYDDGVAILFHRTGASRRWMAGAGVVEQRQVARQ